MRILVTGAKGQLGFDVCEALIKKGHTPVGVGLEEMDITEAHSVNTVVRDAAVEGIIHCAAYTAVDKAQDEPEVCRAVNVLGTTNLAQVAHDLNLWMVYISTDYVFSGEGEIPFKVNDPKGPTNVYGITKLDGENEVLRLVENSYIVRISWVFGINGANFVKTMLKLGQDRPELNVVADQIGSPTYTYDVAQILVDIVESKKFGVYHVTNEGFCSWYDFAKEIFAYAKMNVKVNPVSSAEFVVKATRPKNSRLDKSALDEAGLPRLPSWQDALHRYMDQLKS